MAQLKESKLHRISDGGSSPRAAVVFVHGLDGDAFDTWKTGEAEKDTWPHWLGQDLPNVRVYSLGYDASPSAWLGSAMPIGDRATNALSHFELEDSLSRLPTIFICHSLGGLLVKEALRQAETLYNRPWEELIARTRGIVFLATPHAGARLANYVTGLGTLFGLRPNLDELKANEPALRGLNTWYAQNVGRLGIANLVFYETRDTKGIRIVDETSANPGLPGVIPRPIDANHFEICKPTSRNALTYGLVTSFLKKHVRELSLSKPGGATPRRHTRFARPLRGRSAANLYDEVDAIETILSGEDTDTKVITIHADAGMGKSKLILEYIDIACHYETANVRIDLTQQLNIQDFLLSLAGIIAFNNFAGFCDYLRNPRPELLQEHFRLLTFHFFNDIMKIGQEYRLIVFLDQYEKADKVFKDWFGGDFLPWIDRVQQLLVVVAGRELVAPHIFGTWVKRVELQKPPPECWVEYCNQCGLPWPPEKVLALYKHCGGLPYSLATILQAYPVLQNDRHN